MTPVDPRVFRTYDIRALVPELVDEESEYFGRLDDPLAYQAPLTPEGVELIGRALGQMLAADAIAIGYDSRLSSPAWSSALARGITAEGADVIDIGLSTTDMVYFVSGARSMPGVMVTASHCTRELNGMKIVRPGAQVVGSGTGMEDLRERAARVGGVPTARPGNVTREDVIPAYLAHLQGFFDASAIRPFKVVADAGNGVGGVIAAPLFRLLPQLSVDTMYFEPDGRFPNHEANPFERKNIEELVARVRSTGADFGVAWDGDADRVFFVDELGEPVPGDFITTLVARHFLALAPGSSIVYDLRASRAVREWVERLGGNAVAERVGHSFIKATMRRSNAVFGGEVSGHYYFRDHFYADNGFIPLVAILQMMSSEKQPLSRLVSSLGSYFVTGEINSTVASVDAVIARIRSRYADAEISERDGISVDYPDWHFNVRPSANDPVIRLNLEASSAADLARRRDEVLAEIHRA